MEIDSSLRSADRRIVASLAAAFLGLVFLIGIAENDTPGDVPLTEATFDVAPPTVLPPPPSDVVASDPQAVRPVRPASVPKQAETWFADEAASGTRPDSAH